MVRKADWGHGAVGEKEMEGRIMVGREWGCEEGKGNLGWRDFSCRGLGRVL